MLTASARPLPDEIRGFFGPGSMVWRVDREAAVLLASGPRALLLQVAHPKVAAAVADHSRYASDPLGRLERTLDAIYSFAFADLPTARAAVARVNRRHGPVKGTLPDAVGAHPAGDGYDALDPTLLLWVYATLVDSSLTAYEQFVQPLAPVEADEYYQEMRQVGGVWGIPDAALPGTLVELRTWMDGLVRRGEVCPGPQARTIAASILRSPTPWFPDPLFLPLRWTAIWLLPPAIRAGFGLAWRPWQETFMRRVACLSRLVVPRLPGAVRDLPVARQADRRVAPWHRAAGVRRYETDMPSTL